MSPSAPGRRLATVLFLDIVGSTHVASDLGDARWTTLLTRFRKVVRSALRHHGGHEANFTGDGFLATFPEPAKAIAAGVAIAHDVQELGIDVRVGLHTGEVETIQGHLGGVAVHIGARVMALAGSAEVLVTSTVKDLVHGSSIEFDDVAAHELKGVPGTWRLVAVRSIGGEPIPKPIDPADALVRLATIRAQEPARGRRHAGIMVAAVVTVVAGLALWIAVRPAEPTSGGQASPAPETSLVKLDGGKAEIVTTVADGLITDHLWGALSVENGALFQLTPSSVRTRDVETGQVRETFDIDAHDASAIGFGSQWLASLSEDDSITRVDLVSGQVVDSIDIEGGVPALGAGAEAMWFVSSLGDLGRIDPITLKVQTWPSGAYSPAVVVPFEDFVWICDCENRQIIRFDVTKERFRTFDIPEEAYLVGPKQKGSPDELWLVDQGASAVTPLDPRTAERGRAIGFDGPLADAEIGLGKIWIAAAKHVYVLDQNDDQAEPVDIAMPAGFFASSVAIDSQRNSVWIATCGCPFD